MRWNRPVGVLTATAALGAATILAAPAASAQTGSLILSISPLSGGTAKRVTLTCDPVGGTHPDAAAACKDLTAAGGSIPNIPPALEACLDYWMPVIASASGTWDGRSVSYARQFTNAGCANVLTGGHVFHF